MDSFRTSKKECDLSSNNFGLPCSDDELVEVNLPDSNSWAVARMVDIIQDINSADVQFEVSFGSKFFPSCVSNVNAVRLTVPRFLWLLNKSSFLQEIRSTSSLTTQLKNFNPNINERVEVFIESDTVSPHVWEEGIVIQVQYDSFYFVKLPRRNNVVSIFQKFLLRPPELVPTVEKILNFGNSNDILKILFPGKRQSYSADSSLNDSRGPPGPSDYRQMGSPDSSSRHEPEKTHAISTFHQLLTSETDVQNAGISEKSRSPTSIPEVLGSNIQSESQTTENNDSKMMMDSLAFQERRSKRLKLLEGRKNKADSAECLEFVAADSLCGLVIGKQGENLSRVARNCRVEIRVLPDENGQRRIRVYGGDKAKIAEAKSELEHLFLEIPLPCGSSHFTHWMWSEVGSSTIRDTATRVGLHSLWHDSVFNSIIICGLWKSIEAALGELHTEYERYCSSNCMGGSNVFIDQELPDTSDIPDMPNGSRHVSRRPSNYSRYPKNHKFSGQNRGAQRRPHESRDKSYQSGDLTRIFAAH